MGIPFSLPTAFYHVIAILLAASIILPLFRVLRGPTVFDRMLGVSVTGTKTVILICLVGAVFERLDQFVDIALAYAMLNFIGALAVAKYLDRTRLAGDKS